MLKVVSCEHIDKEWDISDERWNDIKQVLKDYDGKLFKWNKDENIIFEESKEEVIKLLLNATKFESEPIEKYIECFNGGEDLKIGYHTIVYIGDCIKEVQNIINNDDITNRLMNSDDIDKEISKLIKEQAYKVFLKFVKEGFEKINNGHFNWE